MPEISPTPVAGMVGIVLMKIAMTTTAVTIQPTAIAHITGPPPQGVGFDQPVQRNGGRTQQQG